MTAVSDSDICQGTDSDGCETILQQCRDTAFCNSIPGGLGCCPQCAGPGSAFYGKTEAQYQRSLMRPGPPT